MAARTLISKFPSAAFSSGRSIASRYLLPLPCSSPLHRFCPLLSAAAANPGWLPATVGLRCFATRATTSSLNDPSPNWSNRPPKETILLDGCDFEHWLVVVEPPDPKLTRDEIIDSYIKTLAQVLGSEEEARMSIYSVSTKHYFAFGAKVSEEISYKIKPLPGVRWVLPDSYLDVKNKDYGGEPFINGQAVPYDPKYHEEWVRNNARANERNRRNDRPRNFDRSRNFERRRENMQNFQNRDAPPMPNRDFQNQNAMPPRDMASSPPVHQNSMPPRDMPATPNVNSGYQGGAPGRVPGGQGYQGGPGHQGNNVSNQGSYPGYQGSGPGYQGNSACYQGSESGYQGSGPVYQGNAGNFQGSESGYQGGGPGYQGNTGSYQRGMSGYQGGGPSYQGNTGSYQGSESGQGSVSGYQGGGSGYQGGQHPNQGGGPGYHAGGSYYQGGGSSARLS